MDSGWGYITVAGEDCVFCGGILKINDAVYVAKGPITQFSVRQRIHVHKDCMLEAAESANVLTRFEQLRERVLTTGELFS